MNFLCRTKIKCRNIKYHKILPTGKQSVSRKQAKGCADITKPKVSFLATL